MGTHETWMPIQSNSLSPCFISYGCRHHVVAVVQERSYHFMKYETPELAVLKPAISAIQNPRISKLDPSNEEADLTTGLVPSYEDWE